MQQEKFDVWGIVELFGHSRMAGRLTEQNIAGTNMLRVDVPACGEQPSFTRLLGSAAIYAINPTDETTARHMADRLQVKPIDSWDIREMLRKNEGLRQALTESAPQLSINEDLLDEVEENSQGEELEF